jgi:hypothetical protein
MTRLLERPEVAKQYNEYLKRLVSHNTVFKNDPGIRKALDYCSAEIRRMCPDRNTFFDTLGNLVSISPRFRVRRRAVFLSAHIDTVDANPVEWKTSLDPFTAIETDTHIIGRGANDCKAGVAQILLCCCLTNDIPIDNVVFLVSYREEGNQAKTSTAIGENLGISIPLSNSGNLVLCLENTIKVDEAHHYIDIYDCEPCNAFISLEEPVALIRHFLLDNPGWKPIFISPCGRTFPAPPSHIYVGTSGHAATVQNDENVIYGAILKHPDCALSGGDDIQTSVIDNRVEILETPEPGMIHKVILNYRGLTDLEPLKKSISHMSYKEYFPFSYSSGSDRRDLLNQSKIKAQIMGSPNSLLKPRFMANPGRSDASAIWNALHSRQLIDVLTMGPGTRSHIDQGVPRKTHGPDEGFHKQSGHLAVEYILDLVSEYLLAGEPE